MSDTGGERPISTAELSAWLLGGLEQERAAEITDRALDSPSLQARIRAVELRRADWEHDTEVRWTLPPEGFRNVGWPTARVGPAPTLSRGIRPGQRVTVLLDGLPVAESHQLVVMACEAGQWRVLHPEGPEDRTPISELGLDDQGRRRVDLSALPESGRQRWALVFPPMDFPFAWQSAAPWRPLEQALREGRLPAVSFTIQVDA